MEIDFVLTARDGEMLVANITEARVLNIGQYRDYDGAVLETYEGSAPAAAIAGRRGATQEESWRRGAACAG